jgi:hypothetical protein
MCGTILILGKTQMSKSDESKNVSIGRQIIEQLTEQLAKAKRDKTAQPHHSGGSVTNFSDRIGNNNFGKDAASQEYESWTPELIEAKYSVQQVLAEYGNAPASEQRRVAEVLLQATKDIAKK